MSHIVENRCEFERLDLIERAAERLGIQVEHGAVPRYWGTKWGGTEATACDLVLRLPGKYDLGVRRAPDGKLSLICDSELLSGKFGSQDLGRKLLGENAVLLANAYEEIKLEEFLLNSGVGYTRNVLEDGTVEYVANDPVALGLTATL